jgi:HPt (histidine-containing phosphotransfer) domain-containing protein
MDALRQRYAASLADKRAALVEAWESWRASGDSPAHLRELATLAHRLAGSAGSYGYDELGTRASALDRVATAMQDAPVDHVQLDAAVRAVLAAIDTAQARR